MRCPVNIIKEMKLSVHTCMYLLEVADDLTFIFLILKCDRDASDEISIQGRLMN